MNLIERIIGETQERYKEEYLVERTGVVTVKRDVMDERYKRGGENRMEGAITVNVMKRQTVRPKEEMINRGYKEHNGMTVKKYIKVIKPRRFRNAEQVYAFAERINKTAGRTLEDAEMNLLLKTIARGRQYELVCIADITDELEGVTKWER